MDSHKHEELSDELLGREIEAALGVDPSPEFQARIRARVASDRDASLASLSMWRWAGAAIATVVAVMAFWSLRNPVTVPREVEISTPTVASSPTVPGSAGLQNDTRSMPDGSASVALTTRSTQRQAEEARHDVVVSPDEVVALRQLVVAIMAQQVKAVDIPELGVESVPLPAIEEIILEPITLSPMNEALE